MTDDTQSLVYAFAPQGGSRSSASLERFVAYLSDRVGRPVEARRAQDYAELEDWLRTGEVHLAWVPPIVYLRVEAQGNIRPVVCHVREGHAYFRSALVVHRQSTYTGVRSLQGAKAAWVDPLSASGYVLPRLHMVKERIVPSLALSEERFYGSHERAILAVIRREADVAATFARFDVAGRPVYGGWSRIEGADEAIRVLGTVGAIPADVTVASLALDPKLIGAVGGALSSARQSSETRQLVKDTFGVEEFREGERADYDALRRAIESAKLWEGL